MTLDAGACHTAVRARDARFDGLFFTAVKTTGIYCRPVCPARTPRPKNCSFYHTAAAAEAAGFRPCLRCRPELSPQAGPLNGQSRLAQLVFEQIQFDGLFGRSLESLADQFDVSSRHLRRVVQAEYGVPPAGLLRTHRLLFARRLLLDTPLPVTEIAFSSGFSSLPRFNAAFHAEYGQAPRQLRRRITASPDARALRLKLTYREPFDWPAILRYLQPRSFTGVETIDGDCYRRTVRLGEKSGWIAVKPNTGAGPGALQVAVSEDLAGLLLPVLGRVRRLFDLDANPAVIAPALAADPALRKLIDNDPGLRVPGAFDGFELAVRAILGQQVTVQGANTLAARLVDRFAQPLAAPVESLTHHPVAPATLAALSGREIAAIGMPEKRGEALWELARLVESGEFDFEHCSQPESAIRRLMQLPGVGEWTAAYIALRALRWPDAFPAGDLGLRKALEPGRVLTKRELQTRSERWRPWRGYAAMHLWNSLARSSPQVSQ
jgi:AraC family transcriptional regulator, regulatory protein of adaptative response / DNA-3-methyladenine glycosylase II